MDVVFFDGICGLCNHFIDFLFRHDSKKCLRFSPLQGQFIKTSLASPLSDAETIVLLKGNKVFTKSRAVIESVAALGGIWILVRAIYIFPSGIRDLIYDKVARHRYKWFGKKEVCRLPKLEEKQSFLE